MNAGGRGTPENLIVYGVNCVWWDSIDKASTKKLVGRLYGGHPLPCCPHCGSVLMQVEEETWNRNAQEYEAGGQDGIEHPGYVAMMTWSRGKCFPSMTALKAAYDRR